ncbi:agmatinase family protein [Pendulispora albinea]|uniref:Agmatinase family protein n=1 Tax=Pendulispora albinea TaxID=2741071 RepID=A0ABZ2LUH1_9BACT
MTFERPFDPNAAASPDSGIFGLSDPPEDAGVVLIPVPWDVTTSYRAGTSDGPQAILEASRQVDLFDIETGRPYLAKIAMLDESSEIRRWNRDARVDAEAVIAAGGRIDGDAALEEKLARVNTTSQKLNDTVYETARRWIAQKKIVGLVGGDHSTPYGTIRAHAEAYPGMGILHIDAHADLRHAYEGFSYSHASIMECVTRELPGVSRLVQVGIRDLCEEEHDRIAASEGRIRTFYDVDWASARRRGLLDEHIARIVDELPSEVYVSFDIDGLDPVLCPSTGTPVPGGLTFHEASTLLRVVAEAKKIVGFDLNEVSPAPDSKDEWDGNVGARVLYKLIGWTLRSHASHGIDIGTMPQR